MIPLALAERCAAAVVALLRPACAEIAICGSVRRGKALVKDLEIVARPLAAAPTFGEPLSARSPLEALVRQLVRHRELALCPDPKRRLDGPRQKRLWFPSPGLEVELFIADRDNFGNMVAIRTGDQEFSHLLVTQRGAQGLMPEGLRHEGGYLREGDGRVVSCPGEADFFAALGLDAPPPHQRTLAMARRLRAQSGEGRGG